MTDRPTHIADADYWERDVFPGGAASPILAWPDQPLPKR